MCMHVHVFVCVMSVFIPQELLGKWEVPIYNDTYVMLFFGLLKKLVSKWLVEDTNKVMNTAECVGGGREWGTGIKC